MLPIMTSNALASASGWYMIVHPPFQRVLVSARYDFVLQAGGRRYDGRRPSPIAIRQRTMMPEKNSLDNYFETLYFPWHVQYGVFADIYFKLKAKEGVRSGYI